MKGLLDLLHFIKRRNAASSANHRHVIDLTWRWWTEVLLNANDGIILLSIYLCMYMYVIVRVPIRPDLL